MLLLRCREFGDPEWTECSFNGPIARRTLQLLAASLSSSGQFHAQSLDEEGEWVDLVEMDFDDMKEPE